MDFKKIEKFLSKNLRNYDYAYITSDFRGFLTRNNVKPKDLCQNFSKILKKLKITQIVPAYSFTNKGKFHIDKTASNLGIFTKWCLKQKDFIRSEHPIFSVTASGQKKNIVKKVGKSAFGYQSIFYRLLKEKSCLIHFGRPFEYGNTIIHFAEQAVGAYYRENKIFGTKVFYKNRYVSTNYSTYVRKKNKQRNDFISNTIKIAKIIRKEKLIKEIGNKNILTNISVIDFKKCFKVMCEEYYKNKNIFID